MPAQMKVETKLTNIFECKKCIQTWCNLPRKCRLHAQSELNYLVLLKASFLLSHPVEIRRSYYAKTGLRIPTEVRQI